MQGVLGRDGLYKFNSFKLQSLTPSSPTLGHGLSTSSKNFNCLVSVSSFPSSFVEFHVLNTHVVPNNTNVFKLWHNGLGHASKHVVSHILQHCNVSFPNKMTIDVC